MKNNKTGILSFILILTIVSFIFLFAKNKSLNSELNTSRALNENFEEQIENLKKQLFELNNEYSDKIDLLENKLNQQKFISEYKKQAEREYHNKVEYKTLKKIKLRQNPNENSTIISEIKPNEIIYLKASGFEYNYKKNDYPNEWWKVEFNNKVGWIVAKYYYSDILGNNQQKLKENVLIIQ